MNKPTKLVAIYARVSTDRQTADIQINELRDFIKRSKWQIYQEYIDQGYTGANTKRPAFAEMMQTSKPKPTNVLRWGVSCKPPNMAV